MTDHLTNATYQVGQRWRSLGREPNEQPLLLINEISQHPRGGAIYHISLENIAVRSPQHAGGRLTAMSYLPVALQTLEHSGLTLHDTQPINPSYRESRQQWQAAFDAGNAAVYGNTVAAILQLIEKQLHGIANTPRA